MRYQIRKAKETDLGSVAELYKQARKFMELHDNPTQWGTAYPPEELLRRDIARETLYLIWDEAGVHGVFYFCVEEDLTYAVIREGAWHSDKPYGVIHRIAGDGSGGILQAAVTFGMQQTGYLRIDTHEDNYVMQHALEKLGFSRCGIIYVEDGTPRIAYDAFWGVREAEKKDLQQILQLYLHLHETNLPEESMVLTDTWKQIMEDPNHHFIVYEAAGRILSSCVCVVIPNLTRGIRPYALVENVVTHRDCRGHGYATACLRYAKNVAQSAGCYKIMLLTGAKDEKTLAFYQNAGYSSSDKTAFIQWLA